MQRLISGRALAATLIGVLASWPARGAPSGRGTATFVAHGPAGLLIEGKASDVALEADDEWITVRVQLASLKTGIEVRDAHLKEDLQVARYPVAELRVRRELVAAPGNDAELTADRVGQLTLHGQTRAVTFSYRARRKGDVLEVKGAMKINLKEFGIEPRRYLGIGVKPDVETGVTLEIAP